MTGQKERTHPEAASRRLWRSAKKAGASVLISAALIIPRIRRLRRNVPAWTAIRLTAVAAGAWLMRPFTHIRTGFDRSMWGIALVAFGLLVRARPEQRSTDAVARELGALIVLNGGTFLAPNINPPARHVNIFAGVDRLFVVDAKERYLAEVPHTEVARLSAHPTATGTSPTGKAESWDLDLFVGTGGPHVITFRYDGFFAEHLARVAENALNGILKKQLPVLQN